MISLSDKKKYDYPEAWRTSDEIKFIDQIGTKDREYLIPMSRLEVLRLYRQAINQRTEWDNLKRSEIKRYASKAIKDELDITYD